MEEQKHLLLRQDDDSVYKEEESQASQPTALAKRTSWSQTLSSTALLLTGLFAGLALSLYFHKRPCLSQYSTYCKQPTCLPIRGTKKRCGH
ncbi:uncharacterized protein LY89DRAFT_681871 [Mollisia scopiformis]|uniref:Uncharacterized protein n=1 Tax=Mollisia scopiformis TaxID=149040 RepID=A0A194XM59_MOLSC|nr:uncharacterized protein LY89DRAFT_681871 [Mollisia scopiformis]KUJ21330.1 hypothetical protein LY89DRAFT_681871 [Mollisia scopiformis]